MKRVLPLIMLALAAAGCTNDPKAPLEQAAREINDLHSFQEQARRLLPLEDLIVSRLVRDAHIRNPRVGLYFTSSSLSQFGARLAVEFVMLLDIDEATLPTTQPDEKDLFVRELARTALEQCGWEIEQLDSYDHQGKWRITGQLRGANKDSTAGAGLDVLPAPK